MRLGGAGYKSYGSYPHNPLSNKRWIRFLVVTADKTDRNDPYLMDEWWIG